MYACYNDEMDNQKENETSNGGKQNEERTLVDPHGFPISSSYRSLHEEFLPIWNAEEEERQQRWDHWIDSVRLCHENSDLISEKTTRSTSDRISGSSVSQGSEEIPNEEVLRKVFTGCYSSNTNSAKDLRETAELFEQLRALVQMGCPRKYRALCWKLFLDLESCKHRKCEYQQLVEQALAVEAEFGAASSPKNSTNLVCENNNTEDKSSISVENSSTLTAAAYVEANDESSFLSEAKEQLQSAECPLPSVDVSINTLRKGKDAVDEIVSDEILCSNCIGGDSNTMAIKIRKDLPLNQANSHESSDTYTSWKNTDSSSNFHPALDHTEVLDWLYQIDKDLYRTFPGHLDMTEDKINSMRRILIAYACRNPAVGYCQGLNFLAATFLLLLSEDEAFWALSKFVEELLPGYFDARMIAVQVDGRAFDHLLQGSCPRVAEHLEDLQVDIPSATSAWFLVAYVNSLPSESMFRIWDVLFFERSPVVLFRVALALFDIYSQALMETSETGDAYALIQALGPMTCDASALIDTASIAWGHVNDAALWVLRDRHRQEVLELMQASISADSDLDSIYSAPFSHTSPSRSHSFSALLPGGSIGSSLAFPGSRPLTPASSMKIENISPSSSIVRLIQQRSLSPVPLSPSALMPNGRKAADNYFRGHTTLEINALAVEENNDLKELPHERPSDAENYKTMSYFGNSLNAKRTENNCNLQPNRIIRQEGSVEAELKVEIDGATTPVHRKGSLLKPHQKIEEESSFDATANVVDYLDFRSPWPVPPPRRTVSNIVQPSSTWHHLSQHHVQHCVDLYSFFQKVPNFQHPAVASALNIAFNAKRKKTRNEGSTSFAAVPEQSNVSTDSNEKDSIVSLNLSEPLYSRTPISIVWQGNEQTHDGKHMMTGICDSDSVDSAKKYYQTNDTHQFSPNIMRTVDVASLSETIKALKFGNRTSPKGRVPRRFTDGGAILRPSTAILHSDIFSSQDRVYNGPTESVCPGSPGTQEEKIGQLIRVQNELEAGVSESMNRQRQAEAKADDVKETAYALQCQVSKMQKEIDVQIEEIHQMLAEIRVIDDEIARAEADRVACQAQSAEIEAKLKSLTERTSSQDLIVSRLMDAVHATVQA